MELAPGLLVNFTPARATTDALWNVIPSLQDAVNPLVHEFALKF
jgi:hypothetical protein